MGLYVVTEPVVIDGLHYATVPVDPIEVADELASPLVEAGSLVPFTAQRLLEEERAEFIEKFFDGEPVEVTQVDGGEVVTLATEPEPRPSRSRRKPAEDQ